MSHSKILMLTLLLSITATFSACSDTGEITGSDEPIEELVPDPAATPPLVNLPENDCAIDDNCENELTCKDGSCLTSAIFPRYRIVAAHPSFIKFNPANIVAAQLHDTPQHIIQKKAETEVKEDTTECTIGNFQIPDWAKDRIKEYVSKAGNDYAKVTILNLRAVKFDSNGFVTAYLPGISNIDWLDCFPGLIILDLGANNIDDATAISQLTTLKTLRLTGNHLIDMTPLASLSLDYLDLDNNYVVDVTPLKDNNVISTGGHFDIRNNCLSAESLATEGYFIGRGITDFFGDASRMFENQKSAEECAAVN